MESRPMENMSANDFGFAITKAYERGYNKGRADQASDYANTADRLRRWRSAKGSDACIVLEDILMADKDLQSEFDRRVNKAVSTARAKWEKSLQVEDPVEDVPSIPGEEADDHE